MEDRIHSWKEMPDNLRLDDKNVGMARGGGDLHSHQWSIQVVQEDLSADIYVMPEIVNEMLTERTITVVQDKLCEIRNLLGIK